MSIIKLGKMNEVKTEMQATTVAESVAEAPAQTFLKQSVWEDPGILREREDVRTERARHYVMNDGSAKSVVTAEPTGFYDESVGTWEEIDNTVLEKDGVYETKTGGKFTTHLSKAQDGAKVKVSGEGVSVAWEYLGAKTESAGAVSLLSVQDREIMREKVEAFQGIGSEGRVMYENITANSDLEYRIQGGRLKENIIVKERVEEYRYLFSLAAEGLSLRLAQDAKSLELYCEKNGQEEIKFTIPAPYMYDANGESSDDVYFELEPGTDGKYVFVVVANAEWINGETRAFPVVIDPQLVMNSSSYISKEVEYRYLYTSSGSGVSSSNWNITSSDYIKVSRTSSQEYRTTLTIQKSNLTLLDLKISAVRLILKPYRILSTGSCYVGSKYITFSSTNDLSEKIVDITSSFRNAGTTCSIAVTSSSYLDVEFYFYGAYAPILEVEYLTNEKCRPVKQMFTLAGGLTGEYNVAEGDMTASFGDIAEADSILGFSISHVFKKSCDKFFVGKNFRLNLHETLIKNDDSALDVGYIYTDANGSKHGFKDTYYYIDANGTKRTIANKSFIDVDMGGKLTYTTGGKTYEVYQEQHTSMGLKAITTIEGFRYADYLEQRADEYKQLENQLQSYEHTLKSMVLIRASDGDIIYRLKNYLTKDRFPTFIDNVGTSSSTYLLCSESEAYSYKSLVIQKRSLQNEYESIDMQMKAVQTTDGYDNSEDLQKQYANLEEQRNLIGSSDYSSDTQREVVYEQLQLMKRNEALYKTQVEQYFKEYLSVLYQLEQYDRQMPVNYLTDGTIVKGYNAEGRLVAIFDDYENIITVEYDENGKIAVVYDGEDKQIVFDYLPNGLLGSITDMRGRKTGYTYNADGELIKVTFANGKTVALTYDTNGNIQSVESSEKLKSTLTYTDTFRLNKVTNTSTISGVEHGQELAAAAVTMSEMTFTYSSTLTTIADERGNKQYYKVNGDGNVYEYYSEEDGKVVKAEKYDYVPYEKDNVQSAKRSSLYAKAYSAFTSADFTGGDTVNIVLDEYNNASTKTTNARALSDGTTQEAVVTYEYDDNHKCIKESAVVTIKEGTAVLKTYTQIMAYNYNASGSIVRKESYIEGEEYTTGKSIEGTVYDEKGNAVKSFSYNSLDSSSKFYTESEYAENGQTLADYDETGENKTEYEYIPGTNVVRRVKYPNGSKFAYGHEVDDTVTAITQSTAEGEENSTQKRYTCGEVTELASGNNVVRYAYDGKRRVTRVELNGTEEYETYSYTEGETEDTTVATNAKNETFTKVTDKKGRVLRIKYGDATQVSYTYDVYGRVLTVTDGVTGATESNTYNALERQTAYARGSYAESYSYDKYGKLATFVQGTRTYSYAYKDGAARDLDHITVEGITVTPETDCLGRNKGKEISGTNGKIAGEYVYYRKVGDHATNMPSAVYFGNTQSGTYVIRDNVKYEYGKSGNICKIFENGALAVRYEYDSIDRLTREDNKKLGLTVLYAYDNCGNIISRRQTSFTLKTNVEECEFTETLYSYDGDKLLSFGAEMCEYDAIGNPTTYRGKTVAWEKGRQMAAYDGNTFAYDGQGRRISKNSITYTYDGSGRLVASSNGLEYLYDNAGVFAVKHSNATYFYRKDAQGNIIALLDSSGNVVVQYVYDAWGNHAVLDANGADITDVNHIGVLNPFRYRGYFYDVETGLYFLKTRYYDPEIGRFITIDGIEYLDPETINGLNLYAYCGNNPVMNVDPTGTLKWWQWLLGIVAVVAIVGVVVASAIVTGGASLAAIGLGFTIGATASFVGQGVGNLLGGRNFFDGMSVSSILLGGLAGAAYATGMGGALGALGIGVAAGVASSSFQGKSLKEIVWSGFVSGASAVIAYGIGQTFKNLIFKNTDSEFIDFFEMAKVDGANVFKAFTTAFKSSWYTFLPSMSTGLSRFIFNWLGTRGLKNA